MASPKRAYNVFEAAEVLGVSPWLVREAIRRGELYGTRIGKRIIIPAAALDQFLATPGDREDDQKSNPDGNAVD